MSIPYTINEYNKISIFLDKLIYSGLIGFMEIYHA